MFWADSSSRVPKWDTNWINQPIAECLERGRTQIMHQRLILAKDAGLRVGSDELGIVANACPASVPRKLIGRGRLRKVPFWMHAHPAQRPLSSRSRPPINPSDTVCCCRVSRSLERTRQHNNVAPLLIKHDLVVHHRL